MKSLVAAFGWLVVLLSVPALASKPVVVAVGESKVVTLSQAVRTASASNPELLKVERRGKGSVVIEGVALGKSTVELTTRDGDKVELLVHVVSDGSRVYSLSAP